MYAKLKEKRKKIGLVSDNSMDQIPFGRSFYSASQTKSSPFHRNTASSSEEEQEPAPH